MMQHSRLIPLLFCLLAGTVYAEEPAAPAEADAAPATEAMPSAEQKIAEALRAQIKGSEVLTLQVSGNETLALFKSQSKGKALGAVLLLHDLNAHPDWRGVTQSLRRQLPDAGWHTLSIQLPHANTTQATVEQLDSTRAHIAEALAELERRNIKNVVIVGHGQGALSAIDYLADNLAPAVHGLVVVSLDGSMNKEPRLDAARGLARISLPVLDIYGARDTLPVTASAKRRYDLARLGDENTTKPRTAYSDIARDYTEEQGLKLSYRQVKLSGADHNFSNQTSNLVKRLRGWLKRYAASAETEKP